MAKPHAASAITGACTWWRRCCIQTKIQVMGGTAQDAWAAYKRNFTSDVQAVWISGGPAYAFNFTFCPLWARVPFVAVYSLFWTIFMSFRRGDEM